MISVPDDADAGPDLKRTRRRKAPDAFCTDRLPPYSLMAEQGILGCILLSPRECLDQCISRFKTGDEVFYDLRHKEIYKTIVAMHDQREPIDVITLQQRLKDQAKLEEVGGIPYLNYMQDQVPSAANLEYYLQLVVEKYLVRRLIITCTDAVARCYDQPGEVDALLDETEREILQVGRMAEIKNGRLTMRELAHQTIGTIERYFQRQGEIGGLATGFADLDKMTDGLHGGEVFVIAARPSMGKTSLAMNIAEHVVFDLKQPVAVFSLEMTAQMLGLRMLCSRARVNLRSIREGFLSESDMTRLVGAAGKMTDAPMFIEDESGISVMQLRARARALSNEHGVKLFVVDYLQLLHSTSRRARDNRQQEIADISTGVKGLAKELNVPIIVLAQLNRELERERKRKPRLSDLRESGAIEADADLVGLLYKPHEDDEEESDGVPLNLLIAKQRNGPTGDVSLTFLKPYTRFESAAKVIDDVPQDDLPRQPHSDP